MDLFASIVEQRQLCKHLPGLVSVLFNFVCYWLEALSQGNSARTCQGSFMCCSALSDMNTAQVRSSPLVLMSYKIGNGNSYHPPSRCSMKEKVPVTRSSSGRCFMKMHLVPAGTPGGACHVVPASRMETLLSWIVSSSSLLLTTGLR